MRGSRGPTPSDASSESEAHGPRDATAGSRYAGLAWWLAPVGFFGGVLLASSLAAPISASGGADATLAGTLVQQAVFVAVAVGLAATAGPTVAATLGLRGRSPRAVATTLLAAVALYLVAGVVVNVLLALPADQEVLERLGASRSTTALIGAALAVVVAAPVAEEVLFRGLVFAALRVRLSFGWSAALVGGGFGLLHLTGPETIGAVVQLAAFGALLCWVYERTRSLWPAIALHAANNAAGFAFTADRPEAPAVAAALGVVVLSTCAVAIRR